MYDIGIIGGGTAGMTGDLWSESGKKNNYYRRRNIWRSDHFVSECRKLSGDRKCERKRIFHESARSGNETRRRDTDGAGDGNS
jgi:hypothetical protein